MEVGAWTAAGERSSVPEMGRRYVALQEIPEIYDDCVAEALLARHGRETRIAQLLNMNRFNGRHGEGRPVEMMRMEIRRAIRAGSNWTA